MSVEQGWWPGDVERVTLPLRSYGPPLIEREVEFVRADRHDRLHAALRALEAEMRAYPDLHLVPWADRLAALLREHGA